MPSTTHKDYLLITNVPITTTTTTQLPTSTTAKSKTDAKFEFGLFSKKSWKLPYRIDDSDLTFDGKPLNMLYEENRWMAEHLGGDDNPSRGRSRQSRK